MKRYEPEFFVSCLCAAWCGTCREYQPAFDTLRAARPGVGFAWVDIEDEPEVAGEVDVENFPTLVIQRGHAVLFCGPMLPQINLLERLLDALMAQPVEESARYVSATPERAGWQEVADIRARLTQAR